MAGGVGNPEQDGGHEAIGTRDHVEHLHFVLRVTIGSREPGYPVPDGIDVTTGDLDVYLSLDGPSFATGDFHGDGKGDFAFASAGHDEGRGIVLYWTGASFLSP
jgi:hypothetical protein